LNEKPVNQNSLDPDLPGYIPDTVDGADDLVIICDPLSTTADCSEAGSGLLGNIYSYPNGIGVNNYIEKGSKVNALIQMSHLNIPLRNWELGFPGPNGLLKDDSGQVLLEYFALDLNGYFSLPESMSEGDYQFAIASDDGAILDIDGTAVVDNDGTHAVKWKCGAQLSLVHNQKHSIRVRYYQGPRKSVALQVFMRPAVDSNRSCDAAGGFTIVPPSALSH
jgi:hypothetical protein